MYIDLQLGTLLEPLTGRRLDESQARRQAAGRAAFMARQGLRRGDRVLLHYGNRNEFFVDILALWQLGACPVPVDPRLTAFEIGRIAAAVKPALSVWDGLPAAEICAALAAHAVPLAGIDDVAPPAPLSPLLPRLDDPALLLFTSGTTGEPKGVVHTHRSLRARWTHQFERFGAAPFAVTLCALPSQFAWGLVGHALYTWLTGGTLLLLPPYRQDLMLQLGTLCDEHQVSCLPTVPTLWRLASRMARPPQRGSLRLVTCGTGPLAPALWRAAAQWSAAPVFNIYGITETGWLAGTSLDELEGEELLVGDPWGAVIRVLDSADAAQGPQIHRRCAPGESGHVWVQTPALMAGYFGRDDLTAQVAAGGWFCTGDLGALDARGRLVLRGRHKEMINVGGAKVYPADVDAAIAAAADVEDVCTFALEDAAQGETVAVALALRGDLAADITALARVYADTACRLPAHQMPRRWFVLDRVPRTARGKLDRSAVAAACRDRPGVDQRALERAHAAVVAAGH